MSGGKSPPIVSPLPPKNVNISNIFQGDANDTIKSSITNDSNDTIIDTDEEVESGPIPANLYPDPAQKLQPGQPMRMKIASKDNHFHFLPLCLMLNARSCYNKAEHFKDLYQLGPDLIITSETWE